MPPRPLLASFPSGGGMRFLVLGAGSQGGYFGGMLLQGGADVSFLVRPNRAAELAERGLIISLSDRRIRQPVKTLLAGQIESGYDVVLLTCKTYDLASAMEAVAPAVGEHSAVFPILNGINHMTVLADRFGRDRVLGGLSNVAAARSPEGEVVRLPGTAGTTIFGELTGTHTARCDEIQRAFSAASLPSRISDSIIAEMWLKLFGFAAIATIATLTRARAGEIAAAPASPAFVMSVIAECAQVTTAEGHPPPAAMKEAFRELFAQPGSIYSPSILRDLEQGRPTEGDDTIGELVRRADRRGMEVPLLRAALCNLQVHDVKRQQI
jgi:2-dehydropantoate 2-reductase